MSSAMNIDEFMSGVLSAIRLADTERVPDEGIETMFVKAFRTLEQIAGRRGVELRFHCSANPMNSRCATIRYALVRAERDGLLERDGQAWKILLAVEDSADNINASPLTLTEWKMVSKTLKPEPFKSLIPWTS